MTLSTAADHDPEPTHPDECDHPEPEGNVDYSVSGAVEVEAYCPTCETAFWKFISLDDMRTDP